ncbi:hypothetical protein SHELI_v1c07040 [Spiroplasma helicoides]|uniref:Uncharacterized protein n=1 Tax=Spiroplasma helicoides TaxID=216938 RepID=A0A1B3SL52_9MOLU|nr:hypothetical protein [Spiroplasma helicoides]AOG60653.1 hypothetical protein SHELI_v1c07040 [Spiroplasma helicoides]
MAISNNDLKISLIHYLVKVEKYKVDPKLSSDFNVFLYNKNSIYQVISITVGEASLEIENKKIEKLSISLKSAKREKINVLKIAIFEGKQDGVICITSIADAKEKLKQHFAKIINLKEVEETKQNDDDEELSEEELLKTLQDPNSSSNIKLKKLASRMNSNSLVSIILMIMFLLLPIICFGIGIYWAQSDPLLSSGPVSSLFFGASNKALTIIGKQFWRLFTYGFNVQNYGVIAGGLQLLLISVPCLKLSKYTEGIVGSYKFALAMFITYPLTGLFTSVLMPSYIFSGVSVFSASVIGCLAVTTWTKKNDPITLFSKNRLFFPIIILILYNFLVNDMGAMVVIIVAIGISSSITLFFTYNYSKVDFYIAFPCLIIGSIIIIPIVFWIVPTYGLAPDDISMAALLYYVRKGIFSSDYVNSIIFDDNGWKYYVQDTPLGSWLRPFL